MSPSYRSPCFACVSHVCDPHQHAFQGGHGCLQTSKGCHSGMFSEEPHVCLKQWKESKKYGRAHDFYVQDFGVTPGFSHFLKKNLSHESDSGNAALYVPASSSLSTAPRPIYVSQTTSVPAYVSQPTPVYMPQPVYQPTPAYAPAPAPFSVPAANSPTPMRAATASPTTYVMPFGWGFRATNLTRPTPAPTLAPTRGKSLSDMQRDALRQRPLNVTEIVMVLFCFCLLPICI